MGCIEVNLSEEEYKAAKRYAEGLGLSVSEAMRRAILTKVEEWRKAKTKSEVER